MHDKLSDGEDGMQGLIDTGDALVDAARGAARLLGLLAAEGEGGDLFATVAARLEDAADEHWEALREADRRAVAR